MLIRLIRLIGLARRPARAALVLLAVLCLPFAACSDSKKPELNLQSANPPTTAFPADGSATTVAGGSGANTPTTVAKSGGASATTAPPAANSGSSGNAGQPPPPGPTTSTSTPLPQGQFPSKASVSKGCINPGGSQTVSVQTVSNAVVTYVMTYSDQSSHGNNNGGLADSKGKYSDTFVVSPEAPKGTAWVHASSGTKEKGTSFAEVSFTVGC